MKLSQTKFTVLLLVVASVTSGCGVINGIRAKNQLNEGAAAYKAGRFADAQKHFESAEQLDSSQRNAPLFIARAIHAQYRPGVDTSENLSKGQAAIEAYKRVMERNPGDDNSFTAVTVLYRQMKDENKEREWLMQRANLEAAPKEKRSDAMTVLASKEWNCSYEITEQKDNKETIQKPDAVLIQYKKPQDQAEFDKARNCAMKGLELVNQAISLNENNPSAWSYKTNLLREMAKFSQMENKPDEKTRYDKEAEAALAVHTRLSEEAARRKEEEAAKKSPSPPAS
ncbi:MAG: hypothetical protein M3458_17260 [Acidobacteriota bacterium]|nr:hypothetical protein [Acidobacteriota bacterium]